MNFIIREAYDNLDAVKRLLDDYIDEFNLNLDFQHYSEECSSFAKKYAAPDGGIFLAYVENVPVGCCAFYKFSDCTAEMKRLYVDKQYRGQGIGEALARTSIDAARNRNYSTMLLDTLSTMESAVRLYTRLGFSPTTPYYHNPIPTVLFFSLNLTV